MALRTKQAFENKSPVSDLYCKTNSESHLTNCEGGLLRAVVDAVTVDGVSCIENIRASPHGDVVMNKWNSIPSCNLRKKEMYETLLKDANIEYNCGMLLWAKYYKRISEYSGDLNSEHTNNKLIWISNLNLFGIQMIKSLVTKCHSVTKYLPFK